MVLNSDWVIPGGLNGMFVDHNEYLRRDRVDTRQYYKAGLDMWSWKGKQWAMPLQAGGEIVLYNKMMFDERGVKYPHKDWTYDDLLAACQKLNNPSQNTFAINIGQNGLHYMMGTFVYNHGGKLLNEAKDKALYGDDPHSIQGAELDVDLHVKYKYTPPPEALAAVPQGKAPLDIGMVAMEINGLFRHTNARAGIGAQNLDFAPPPKGKVQMATVGGNAWAMSSLSKAQEAAWRCLKWLFSKEGQANESLLKAVSWPSIVATASTPQWLEIFKGTHIDDVSAVWQSGGHDLMVLPEGSRAWAIADSRGPLGAALRGEIPTRQAMQESARQMNELFSQRPPNWK
jgi:ABC-type glycerol-3-phosphate transport system substrate-binding protein